MKLRFTFETIEVDVPNEEIFSYLQEAHGYFEDSELKDISEQELFVALTETDPSELFLDLGFELPEVVRLEHIK